jgi:hypothetical protein
MIIKPKLATLGKPVPLFLRGIEARGLEIDLIIERPNERPVLIEIKSTDVVHDRHLTHLRTTIASFPEAIGYCFCNEPIRRRVGDITVVPWWEGLEEVGLG